MKRLFAKRLFALSVLSLCSIALAQGKYRPGQYPVNQNPADYTIKVHISATHLRACDVVGINTVCGEAMAVGGLYVDASVDGKKVELFGAVDKHQAQLIAPGDYSAMLPKKARDGGNVVLGQAYYVLLPNRTAWFCGITGFSE